MGTLLRSGLLSNVRDAASGDQLASGLPQLLIEHGGVTIGLLGLVEEEWIATLATLEPEDIVFEDPVACTATLTLFRTISHGVSAPCRPHPRRVMYFVCLVLLDISVHRS